MRTGSQDFLVDLPRTEGFSSLGGKCSGRTCLHTVSAGLTGTLSDGPAERCSDGGLKSSLHGVNGTTAYHLITSIHASVAENTQVRIIGKERVGVIHRELGHLALVCGSLHAVFHAVVLQLTSAVLCTGEAVCLVIGQKQVQDGLSGIHYLLAHGLDHIALAYMAGTCGIHFLSSPVFDLHHTHTAGAIRKQVFDIT